MRERRVLNGDALARSNTRSQTGASRPDLTLLGD